MRLRGVGPVGPIGCATIQRALGSTAGVTPVAGDDPEHFILEPEADRDLGEAIAALAQAGFAVLACRQEYSEVEEAFLALTAEASS